MSQMSNFRWPSSLAWTTTRDAPSALFLLAFKTDVVQTVGQRVRRSDQLKHSNDTVPDAFSTSFHYFYWCHLNTLPTLKWKRSWRPSPLLGDEKFDVENQLLVQALRVVTIWGRHHVKSFSVESMSTASRHSLVHKSLENVLWPSALC